MGALTFTSPLLLAALIGLPVVWWLLRATPPAPRQHRFPPFLILRRLKNERETPDRTPWWLLAMRLLLLALAIVALAGPVLNAPPPPSAGAGPIALVIDDTYAAAHDWRARQDAMLAAAAEAARGDRMVYLIPTAPSLRARAIEPMTGEAARKAVLALTPKPYAAERGAAAEAIAATPFSARPEFRWLTDGLASDGDAALADALAGAGAPSAYVDDRPKPALRALGSTAEGPAFRVERLATRGAWRGDVVALASDGRELARQEIAIASGARDAVFVVALPLAIRNEIAVVRIVSARSAGAVQLVDARDRRALVGLMTETVAVGDRLLSGAYYIRQALKPYAQVLEGNLSALLEADVSVIVLDDIGAIRPGDLEVLTDWVKGGGVLIRFAGPILAEAAQSGEPPLLPVRLRGGGRAFGGALTWETPQEIDAFAPESPFAGLVPPSDGRVRRQVLAEPGGETTQRTWARLKDGTPLVTGAPLGEGVVALFHTTATPQWSDLPLSGVFVEMMRRLAFMSELGPEADGADAGTRYPPLRLLDGFGAFQRPGDDDGALSLEDLQKPPAPGRRAGFYGTPDAPLALNVIGPGAAYEPLKVSGMPTLSYKAAPPKPLAPPLFVIALALLLFDALATLALSGRLPLPGLSRRASSAGVLLALALIALGAPREARAEPLDQSIPEAAMEAALTTRLAYVRTGDTALDRLSAQGLAGLSRELYRRTALEPGPPIGVDPETDDLSVYPFLYWPIGPGAEAPSEAALANIENFMRFGGMILFDTRDDERAVAPGSTPESAALQRVLGQLNIPPLTPVTRDHVLSRSFYLLSDLHGRVSHNPVWVAAETAGATDNVTPVIIGGRDWAGAWAVDSFGREARPMGQWSRPAAICSSNKRECAYRAGVNMVMVALTGNYKSDQVHTPTLLERLGQ